MTVDQAIPLVPEDWFWEVALGVMSGEDGAKKGPYWATVYPKNWSHAQYDVAVKAGWLDFEGEILAGAPSPGEALELAAGMAGAVNKSMRARSNDN